MGRQKRTQPDGSKNPRFNLVVGSSTKATIGNSGVTVLTTDMGTDYTLQAPEEGVYKTLVMSQATTGVFVRAMPKGDANTVIFASTTTDSIIEFDAAGDKAIHLLGISSTRWQVLYRTPATTAINVGSS